MKFFLLSVFLMLPSAFAAAEENFRFERPLMGTRFTILCHAGDRAAAGKAADAAFALAGEVNQAASDHLPESELSQLASKPAGTPIPLSPLLYELLDHSRRLAETTDGAFDPTLGPLSKIWRATRDQGCLPAAETLQSARDAVGWRRFTLDPKSRSIIVAGRCVSSDRLANSGLRVQASCMGMGQAAGAAAALAAKNGTTPLEVPLKEIHDLLRAHGAIIPGDV